MPLTVEIFSDVVCPWCYIGKRRFEAALEQFEHRDEVAHHVALLRARSRGRPGADGHRGRAPGRQVRHDPRAGQELHAEMTERAAAEGLEYNLDISPRREHVRRAPDDPPGGDVRPPGGRAGAR